VILIIRHREKYLLLLDFSGQPGQIQKNQGDDNDFEACSFWISWSYPTTAKIGINDFFTFQANDVGMRIWFVPIIPIAPFSEA